MAPVRLLLAEDDYELRRWLCLALARLPCVVTEARDGKELQALLLGERFDLVVTDIRMPSCSGLDAAVAARQAGVATPIIFITGYGDEATAAVVAGLGRALLLAKPVDGIDLVAHCRRLLGPGDTPSREAVR